MIKSDNVKSSRQNKMLVAYLLARAVLPSSVSNLAIHMLNKHNKIMKRNKDQSKV